MSSIILHISDLHVSLDTKAEGERINEDSFLKIPFSKEFGCTTEDLEDLFMDLLDMSSLEALHGTLEIANHKCLLERLDADLRLPWYVDVLELLSVEQGDELKNKVANEIIDGKSYDIALDEGRKDLFNLLKNINNE